MALPDLSDIDKMVFVGKMTVLRKARREAAQKLRDCLLPLLNSIERQGNVWDVSAIGPLVAEIQELNQAIADLN